MPGSEPERLPHAVIVLAAGHGRRMGGPKALMLVGGEPWWRIQQRRLRRAGCAPVWIVSALVRAAWACEPEAPPDPVESDPDAPMFASFWRGVQHLSAPGAPQRIFVLPVDVPAPDPSTWAALADAAAGGVAIPACAGRRGHPVCLSARWIDRVLRRTVRAADPASLRLDALIAAGATEVTVADPCVTVNLNTPADVTEWSRASR